MNAAIDFINTDFVGIDWVLDLFEQLTTEIEHITPVEFNEKFRYLSRGETPFSGLMDFDLTPYWIKPLNQLDPYDPTREIWIKKGVKTSFNTTMIEGGLLYFAAHMKAFHSGYVTADKELAQSRMETHVIPMFQNSGFGDIFRSADADTSSKTGKTKKLLQWLGGGSLTPEGARNADKFRQYLWMWIWFDEIASWAETVGKDGDPIRLVMSRAEAFWNMRKFAGGSTPQYKGGHTDRMHARGNQQIYECHCLKCGFPMWLKWRVEDINKPGVRRGLVWEYKNGGDIYDPGSVRYECWNCGHGHQEHDKERFVNKDNADWKATATPVEPHVESYHIPALLSRFKAWPDHVATWHEAFTRNEKVKSQDSLQVFYNNVLGESFEIIGEKLSKSAAYSHRREFYHSGQILNDEVEKYCRSPIMFVSMTVDVQGRFLSVATWGITIGGNSFLIEYKKIKDPNKEIENPVLDIDSPVWGELRDMIDNPEMYISDDHKIYPIAITLIDSGWGDSESTVSEFCSEWSSGVYPIKGDSQSHKRIASFYEYKTSLKNSAYMLAVDHYKDRMAPVLRRRWQPDDGDQKRYTVNFPIDISNAALKELTVEFKREERRNGRIVAVWHRPGGARNELWDLLIYLQAAVDILVYKVCTVNLELKEADFQAFWEHVEDEQLFWTEEDAS